MRIKYKGILRSLIVLSSVAIGIFIWSQTKNFRRDNTTLYNLLNSNKTYKVLKFKYKKIPTTYDKNILNLGRKEKTILLSIILFMIFFTRKKLKTKTTENKLNKISEQVDIVVKEKTDEPIMYKGSQKISKNGKKEFIVKEHYPTFDFSNLPKSFYIRKIHPRAEKNLFIYLNGLLSKLNNEGYIETSSGKVNTTGFPGQYVIELNNKKQINTLNFLKEIRWFKEETINGNTREIYPTVEIGEKSVIIVLNGIQLTKATIDRGLESFQNFFKVKLKDFFKQEDDIIEFSYQTKLDRIFNKEDIPSKWNDWNEQIIKPMRDQYSSTGVEEIFLGELEDPNINWKTRIYWKLTQSPHLLVVGQTRSGKTRSNLSIVSTLCRAYPDSPFLFADGKGSVDYDPFAAILSDYPVAKPAEDNDALIELANIIMIAWKQYKTRKIQLEQLQKLSGKSFTSYVQYNIVLKEIMDKLEVNKTEFHEIKSELEFLGVISTERIKMELSPEEEVKLNRFKELENNIEKIESLGLVRMPRFFLVIDEFAAFVSLSPLTVEKLMNVEGSIFNYINRLLRESASVGFTLILASQRAQSTDFPTAIRSNLTSWLIHSVNSKDANFLGVEGHVEKQSSGKFILKIPGLWCPDTGHSLFKMSLPYIGDNEGPILDLLNLERREHREFDYDLIYNSGIDLNGKNMDVRTIYKHIKQAFVIREDYEVIESIDPEYNYISLTFRADNKEYAVGVITVEEVADTNFVQKIKNEREDYFEYQTIFFVIGKNGKLPKDMDQALPRAVFLFEYDFTRKLKEALELNKNRDKKRVFMSLIDSCFTNEDNLDSVFVVNDKKEDRLINIKELNRIQNIKGNIEKGDAFEEWFLMFERRLGYDTVNMRDLIDEGIFPDIFSNKRADGGLDLCRWIDKPNKKAVAIQLKNYSSKALNTDPIDKMVKTRELYKAKGIEFVSLLLVTTGKMTKQALKEAEFCKVTVIDGAKLKSLVKQYNTSTPVDEQGEIVETKKTNNLSTMKVDTINTESEEMNFQDVMPEESKPEPIESKDETLDELETIFGKDRAALIRGITKTLN